MNKEEIVAKITSAGQLASLLEISGYPKPGNVHRTRDFPQTRYEHFLAGTVAIKRSLSNSAKKGVLAGKGKISLSDIEIGEKIEQGINSIKNMHYGGNTHLGVMLLFAPLSAAAGKTLFEESQFEAETLRKNFDRVMKSTTSKDSVHTCKAIRTAINAGKNEKKSPNDSWLGRLEDFNFSLTDNDLERKLTQRNISLYKLMQASSGWDGVAQELTNKMEVSFKTGFPTLKKVYERQKDINVAVVHTYLKIFSEYPDTFIARKVGLEETDAIDRAVEIGMQKSREVSSRANQILRAGGLKTERGRKKLEKLDEDLYKENGRLNPGTTADLTASSTMIALLSGLKY